MPRRRLRGVLFRSYGGHVRASRAFLRMCPNPTEDYDRLTVEPLLERESELETLVAAADAARAGKGVFVLVAGFAVLVRLLLGTLASSRPIWAPSSLT